MIDLSTIFEPGEIPLLTDLGKEYVDWHYKTAGFSDIDGDQFIEYTIFMTAWNGLKTAAAIPMVPDELILLFLGLELKPIVEKEDDGTEDDIFDFVADVASGNIDNIIEDVAEDIIDDIIENQPECEEGDEECIKAAEETAEILNFVDGAISGDDVVGEAIGDLAEDILVVECEEGDEECEKAAQEAQEFLDFVDKAVDDVAGDVLNDLANDILVAECEEGDEECEKAAQEAQEFLDLVDGAVSGDDVAGNILDDLVNDILAVECVEGDEECLKAAEESGDLLDIVGDVIDGKDVDDIIGDVIDDAIKDIFTPADEEELFNLLDVLNETDRAELEKLAYEYVQWHNEVDDFNALPPEKEVEYFLFQTAWTGIKSFLGFELLPDERLISALGFSLKTEAFDILSEGKLGPVKLFAEDFVDISRDNELYFNVLVAPEDCRRGVSSDCTSSTFTDTAYVWPWGTEQIMTFTDGEGNSSTLHLSGTRTPEFDLYLIYHTVPESEIKHIACAANEKCQVEERLSIWKIKADLNMEDLTVSIDYSIGEMEWEGYNLNSNVDFNGNKWTHTLTQEPQGDKIFEKEFNFGDPEDAPPVNLHYVIENTPSDGNPYSMHEQLTFIPGFAMGTILVETVSIPEGSDFTSFHVSQNGGYNMAKIDNPAGIVTLVCETEGEKEPCNDSI